MLEGIGNVCVALNKGRVNKMEECGVVGGKYDARIIAFAPPRPPAPFKILGFLWEDAVSWVETTTFCYN